MSLEDPRAACPTHDDWGGGGVKGLKSARRLGKGYKHFSRPERRAPAREYAILETILTV